MPNNSIATALQLSNPIIAQSQTNKLDTQNPSIFYQFQLTGASSASISLTGLTGDANLTLVGIAANQPKDIQTSANPGRLAEAIVFQNMEPGIYYLRVDLAAGATAADYTLNISSKSNATLNDPFWRNYSEQAFGTWQMDGLTRATTYTITNTPQIPLSPSWKAQFFSDFNGDGEDDIAFRNIDDGKVCFVTMKGGKPLASNILNASLGDEIKFAGDLNGDGRSDLIWQSKSTNAVTAWVMDKTGTNFDIANSGVINNSPILKNWTLQKMGDFDGDGQQDLCWRTETGQVAIWLMDGKNVKPGGAKVLDYAVGFEWQLQLSADLNKDNKSDLIWRNKDTGLVVIWRMNGTTATDFAFTDADPAWQIKTTGDANGDGQIDLFWTNPTTSQLAVWTTQASGLSFDKAFFTLDGTPFLNGLPGWSITGVADFNNDGKADIMFQNEQLKQVGIWQLNGSIVEKYQAIDGIPIGWKMEGTLQRKLKREDSSISGTTPETAFYVGALNTFNKKAVYSDVVNAANRDIYKFKVEYESIVSSLGFSQGGTGVTLKLFAENATGGLGNEIGSFTPGLNNLNLSLAVGTYYVRLETASVPNVPYTLTFDAIPKLVNPKPEGLSVVGSGVDSLLEVNLKNSTREVQIKYTLTNTELFPASDFYVAFNLIDSNPNDPGTSVVKRRLDVTGTSLTGTTASGTSLWFQTAKVTYQALVSGQVTVRLPDATDTFWSTEKIYLIEMVVDPDNKLLEAVVPGRVDGEKDNVLTPTPFNEAPFQISVKGIETSNLKTDGLVASVSGTTINITQFKITNTGLKGTPQIARIPVKFYLSRDNVLDSGDLELFKADGFSSDELNPIKGATTFTGSTARVIPAYNNETAIGYWSQFTPGSKPGDFYLLMSVNESFSDSGIEESNFDDNFNANARISTTSVGIDAVNLGKLTVPKV